MKYIDEYRDATTAKAIAQQIQAHADPKRQYALMEFCGGHTHAIARYGISELLPNNVRMIHGPGCPVCVLPIGRIDQAIDLALRHQVILCVYGDTMRVPASGGLSLMKARAKGADVRMVYAASDALQLAIDHPDKQVVFFAIGFETTTPPPEGSSTKLSSAATSSLQSPIILLTSAGAVKTSAFVLTRSFVLICFVLICVICIASINVIHISQPNMYFLITLSRNAKKCCLKE